MDENLVKQEEIEKEEKMRAEARAKVEKEIKEKEEKKKVKQAVTGGLIFLGIVNLIIAITSIGGDDEKTAPQVIQYITEIGTPERKVEAKVIEILNEKTNMGEKRMKKITIENNEIWISYVADENLTSNMTRGGIWTDIKELLQGLPAVLSSQTDSIVFESYLKLVDQYGNESIDKVMMMRMTKDTWEEINWDSFIRDNFPNIADHYWEHPVLKK